MCDDISQVKLTTKPRFDNVAQLTRLGSRFLWRTIGAKIQLLNFACTFGIRCCSFTICTYICNSTFKFAISLFQLTI